ncbi:recQ-like DNA helicase BLM, partial [Saccoglossus kowalevskii]
GAVIEKDVTEYSKMVVDFVRQITSNAGTAGNKKTKWQANRYTLNHVVDVFRGAQTSKVLSCGHNRLALYSKGAQLGHHNCERLLRKLVLDGILHEEMQSTYQDQTALYIKLGPKAYQLNNSNMQ